MPVTAILFARPRRAMGIGWRHPHYAGLLQTGPALDFIEVHSENFFAPGGAARAVLRQGREHYPVSLHGVGLSLGSACGVDEWHLDATGANWCRKSSRCASATMPALRAATCPAPSAPVHAADLLPVPFTREALAVMCANVQRVQERLKRPIAVENLSAYLDWSAADMRETEFLATLAQRTGCSLLVDVNNLYVNAQNARLRGELNSAPGDATLRWPAAATGSTRSPPARWPSCTWPAMRTGRHRDRRPRQPRLRRGVDAVPPRPRPAGAGADADRVGHRRAGP